MCKRYVFHFANIEAFVLTFLGQEEMEGETETMFFVVDFFCGEIFSSFYSTSLAFYTIMQLRV